MLKGDERDERPFVIFNDGIYWFVVINLKSGQIISQYMLDMIKLDYQA